MADIFLSYASEDRESARLLATALSECNWDVWWDRESILAGSGFEDAIQAALNEARSVVVLWSKNSVSSGWVKDEAAEGRERGVLVPALLDGVRIPLGFRQLHTADLAGWQGDPSHDGFQHLKRALSERLGSSEGTQSDPLKATGPARLPPEWLNRRIAWGGSILALVLGAAVLGMLFLDRSPRREKVYDCSTSAELRAEIALEMLRMGESLADVCLRRADLDKADLDSADLSSADLKEASLKAAGLEGAKLHRADLVRADLSAAVLINADLSRANLSEALLRGADLTGADLSVAGLRGANLDETNLTGTNLEGADLIGAHFAGACADPQPRGWPEGLEPLPPCGSD